jgi:hypothetical protein
VTGSPRQLGGDSVLEFVEKLFFHLLALAHYLNLSRQCFRTFSKDVQRLEFLQFVLQHTVNALNLTCVH